MHNYSKNRFLNSYTTSLQGKKNQRKMMTEKKKRSSGMPRRWPTCDWVVGFMTIKKKGKKKDNGVPDSIDGEI